MDFDKEFKNFRKDTSYIDASHENRENIIRLGIDPDADDTVFGTDQLYCGAHMRVHGAGWCDVRLSQKRPLKATDRKDAIAEAVALGFVTEKNEPVDN